MYDYACEVVASEYRGVSTNACEFVVCFNVFMDVYENRCVKSEVFVSVSM